MLAECLDSIASQSLSPGELVLVDDGSTDESTLLAKRDFRMAHPELVKTINGGHGGIPHVLNTGLAADDGEYVCFFASDDYLKKDFLEKLVAAAEKADADEVFAVMNTYLTTANT